MPDRVSQRKRVSSFLPVVPEGTRILIVNEADFFGTGTDLTLELWLKKDIMVETGASAGQKARVYKSRNARKR